MIFYMPIPQSFSKKRKIELAKETTFHVKKSDRDNCQKFTSDVLEIAGVFKNDSQSSIGISAKIYSGHPRIEILVSNEPDNLAFLFDVLLKGIQKNSPPAQLHQNQE